jgi:chromosome segregation protein
MRLRRVKLAGFKSFVDPTAIDLPSRLVGVVGPNGCGKSNVIDAARWVMGESSAKHLRGDSMEDVIFSGSTSRKPIGQASVELVFDNSDGSLGGEYAGFSEISVRRLVTRDGQSQYFLNGSRCRRRDITDIFLGTGLGPRSYAIIEQGMISRLIEAKPEELRVYLEEAAGISKYKERRRETENRIRHTRENLDRLNDLREELGKQLGHLQRQARTAERYTELKAEERRAKAELLALRLGQLDRESETRQRELSEQETALERSLAAQRQVEAEIERGREAQVERNEAFNAVQGRYYALGADISRVEQSIQYARETRLRQERDMEQAGRSLESIRAHREQDENRLREIAEEIGQLEPEQREVEAARAAESTALTEAEAAMQDWQRRFEAFTHEAAQPGEVAQAERARIEQLEGQVEHGLERLRRHEEERAALDLGALQGQVEGQELAIAEARSRTEALQAELQRTLSGIQESRAETAERSSELDARRSEMQDLRGRLTSLQALQQAALGKDEQSSLSWLRTQGLGEAVRLGERISAQPGWERAAETVLGGSLEAVCVDGLDPLAAALGEFEQGAVTLFETGAAEAPPAPADSLLARVQAPWPLTGLLGGIYAAESLNEALAWRARLGPGESVITRDGIWIGANWLRVARDPDAHSGVLEREQEIADCEAALADLGGRIADLEHVVAAARERQGELEAQREQQQVELNRAHRALADAEGAQAGLRLRLEQAEGRRTRLEAETGELNALVERHRGALEQATHRRNEAVTRMETLAGEREALEGERQILRERLEQTREGARRAREASHELALRVQGLRSTEASTREAMARTEAQLAELESRREELEGVLREGEAPVRALQEELDGLLANRVEIERELGEARGAVQSGEAALRELEQGRQRAERAVEDVRAGLERLRIAFQEVTVRRQTLQEQLAETGFELAVLVAEMPEEAEVEAWQTRVEDLERRIHRLGPINLAAIDEFKEQSERKAYLDQQNDDLESALETLENAIRKIDRETRSRFKETFERVNTRLQESFPKLFGGGNAHLEMTGDDLLTTGVAVLARPPGKRLSTIHLMSGGEKALTAVALVFAIFELNPAPFCMLDEVDAPLDEANVGRFCDLVREMSSRVQFIFITHNKTTMELAEHLIGVTMREPGVSRLVAVDVDEAAQMATA